jgi:hypothetical protein
MVQKLIVVVVIEVRVLLLSPELRSLEPITCIPTPFYYRRAAEEAFSTTTLHP